MPCIEVKTSVKATKEQKNQLKSRLGQDIRTIPGKSEAWLMVVIQDGLDVYFKGDGDAPAAFIEVKIYGHASPEVFDALTGKITDAVHDVFAIDPGRVYVKYEEVENWGFNGSNF